jgi:hypothetical protein
MNPEELADLAWTGRLDEPIERACRFFAEHRCLDDLAPTQVQRLRELAAKYQTWTGLREKLEGFLTKQAGRDERQGVTGWKKVGPAMLACLKNLPEETGLRLSLKEEAKEVLDRLGDTVAREGFSSTAAGLAIYLLEAETATDEWKKLLAQHRDRLHCLLASTFINTLCQMYRAKEVFREPGAEGVYGQRTCP